MPARPTEISRRTFLAAAGASFLWLPDCGNASERLRSLSALGDSMSDLAFFPDAYPRWLASYFPRREGRRAGRGGRLHSKGSGTLPGRRNRRLHGPVQTLSQATASGAPRPVLLGVGWRQRSHISPQHPRGNHRPPQPHLLVSAPPRLDAVPDHHPALCARGRVPTRSRARAPHRQRMDPEPAARNRRGAPYGRRR